MIRNKKRVTPGWMVEWLDGWMVGWLDGCWQVANVQGLDYPKNEAN